MNHPPHLFTYINEGDFYKQKSRAVLTTEYIQIGYVLIAPSRKTGTLANHTTV